MSEVKTISSEWFADEQLIITHISGEIEKADLALWEKTLYAALDQVPDSGTFKIFINLHGFKAVDLDTHKQFRSIIPLTLANYGWKVGYVAMFPEDAGKMVISNKRNVQCIAAVHCHQDVTKIEKYESLYSSDNERFFAEVEAADAWIRSSGRAWLLPR